MSQVPLPLDQRPLAQVLAVKCKQVERVEARPLSTEQRIRRRAAVMFEGAAFYGGEAAMMAGYARWRTEPVVFPFEHPSAGRMDQES